MNWIWNKVKLRWNWISDRVCTCAVSRYLGGTLHQLAVSQPSKRQRWKQTQSNTTVFWIPQAVQYHLHVIAPCFRLFLSPNCISPCKHLNCVQILSGKVHIWLYIAFPFGPIAMMSSTRPLQISELPYIKPLI